MGSLCSTAKVEPRGDDGGPEVEEKKDSGPVNEEAIPSTSEPPKPSGDDEDNNDDGILRILLLGAAESGKTTLLEQIRMVHKQPFTEYELIHRKAFIYNNIINAMKVIILNAQKNDYQLLPENESKAQDLLSNTDECLGPLTPEEYEAVISLWKDPAIQESYKHRGEYNLNDSAQYFFDDLERINQPNFHPTPLDLIRAYVPTIGIQNIIFRTKKRTFQLFDIGGQKVDRRKWATMYDGIDAIFFCSAISEYDQKFEYEDDKSRLMDSLELLEQICIEPKFKNTPIFVFLNETDVLKEKLNTFPLGDYFDDYSGTTEKEAFDYLKATVISACHDHPNDLFIEFICAIDNDAMVQVLDNVFKKLLQIVK